MDHICPTCGQRVLMRYGVQFSPKLADIFDAIAGRHGGVSPDVLASMFYPNADVRKAYNAVRVSINHINDKLEETDYQIAMPGLGGREAKHGGARSRGGNYRLIQREVASG